MCHYYMEIQSDSCKHSDVTADVKYQRNSSSLAEGNYVNLREGGTLMTEGCRVIAVIMEGTRRPANHSFTISRGWV
jgi:hypothetical protein